MYLNEAQKERQAAFKARLGRFATNRKKRKILEALEKVRDDPKISPEKKREFALRVMELIK